MTTDDVLRQQLRELKRQIRDDPEVLARYDLDGDGNIDGVEWQRAVELLRAELAARPEAPAAATASTLAQLRTPPIAAAAAAGPSLATCRAIVIEQQVETREVFVGYETANRYLFRDRESGHELGGLDENRGGAGAFLVRQLLGSGRPLHLSAVESSGGVWLEGTRPFHPLAALLPPALEVRWNDGELGTIQRRWPLVIARRYEIAVHGEVTLWSDWSVASPWTFPVKRGGRPVATVRKKWSGVLKESFTDADTFSLAIDDAGLSPAARRMLLLFAMVVDFDFFEANGQR